MKKRSTNTECIVDMMEFSDYGALTQAFVITAIESYANQAMQHRLSDTGFINPDAWQGIAKELLDKINLHFKKD